MVIHFCPGKLGAKPDALTRCWDVYHKGGNSDSILTNLSNLWPIFTQEQFVHPFPLTPYLPNNFWAQVILNRPLMKVAYFNLTIRYLYRTFWTSNLRSYSTNMTMFLLDISGRTRPSKQFIKNMYGLISEPSFKISVNPVLLAKGSKHLGTSLTDFWSNFQFPRNPGTQFLWTSLNTYQTLWAILHSS